MRTILFLVCFTGVIFFSTSLQNNYQSIVANILSIAFVLGGTLIATLISYPVEKIKNIRHVLGKAYQEGAHFDYAYCTRYAIHLAREYKRLGFKTLEEAAEKTEQPLLKLGLQLIADNTSWDDIRSAIEKEFIFESLQKDSAQRIIRSMARYAPSFGLAGTILGLMRIFPEIASPENIGVPLSMALLTTLYGVLAANLLLLPIANKLRDNATDDEIMLRFLLEALQCIQEREYSVVIEQRLTSLMPKEELVKYHREKSENAPLRIVESA